MTPDLKINDYYNHFISESKKELDTYTKYLDEVINKKIELINYVNTIKKDIAECFGIELDNYIEWKNKVWTEEQTLYNKVCTLIKKNEDNPNKSYLIQLIKALNTFKVEANTRRLIRINTIKINIKPKQYKDIVRHYYEKVHEFILNGNGYKFNYGIGTFVINRWKFIGDNYKIKPIIDYNETNKKKAELIAKGAKLYDEKEAAWYKRRNIPYDGIDYRVYKRCTHFYDMTFIKSAIFGKSMLEYEHVEYISAKYRGNTQQEIADKICKTKEDIYKLQVDIKYKLNVLLYLYPMSYLNFVRNAEENRYKSGAHNS